MHQHLPAARTTMKPRPLLLAICVWLSAPSVNAEPANCGPAMYKICCRGLYINSHRDPADTSGLDACITCPINYYCDGGTANPIPCKASSCIAGTYTTGCDEFLAPICQACPSCSSGMWNSGCGGSSPGVCTKCNACPKGSSLLTACSALADTKCTGVSCTTQNTSVCEELFCNTNVESNVGKCAMCPTGWLASGLACTPCPKLSVQGLSPQRTNACLDLLLRARKNGSIPGQEPWFCLAGGAGLSVAAWVFKAD